MNWVFHLAPDRGHRFRVAGTAALMAHELSQLADGIWKNQPWGTTIE